ncbi:MAG: hypothetical protein P8Z68_10690 [Kineosporiaceae bacterium]|jgi:hypothetical protein
MTQLIVRAVDDSGTAWENPTQAVLQTILSDLSATHPFVVVERHDRGPSNEYYMQVYLNDDRSHVVEFRDGDANRHYQALIPPQQEGVAPIAALIADWAYGGTQWQRALPWQQLRFPRS